MVLVGADCPALTGDDVASALTCLAGDADVVFGPASDGGYYLVGMRACHAGLFSDVEWGTASVLATSLQHAARLGLECHMLAQRADLDTPADYRRWQTARASR